MQTLLKNGYTPISFTDLYNKIKNDSPLPEKPVIITFDDGYIGEYEIAYPILKTLNIKATIFVVTDWVGNSTDDGIYFSWDNAREMNQSGWVEIYNHSSRHLFYTEISTEQFLSDILEANEIIDKELGVNKLKVFAYPYGNYNDDMVNSLKENGFDIQVYDLGVDRLSNMDLSFIRRINIPMDMTGSEIIENIQSLSYTE